MTREAMDGATPADVAWLTDGDAYYYQRGRGSRAPVLRTKFDDEHDIWFYLDAADGSLVQTEVRGSRVERWLYQGLHSLDAPLAVSDPVDLAPVGRCVESRWLGAQPHVGGDRLEVGPK